MIHAAAAKETVNRAAGFKEIFWTHYVSPSYRVKFPTINYEYGLMQGPKYDQERAYNASLFANIGLALNGRKALYGDGAISKGMLANYMAVQAGPFPIEHEDGSWQTACHVYDMDETIGATLMSDQAWQQNMRIQIQKNHLFQTLFPGHPILMPNNLQGAASIVGMPNFDQGAKRRDKGWMQVWTGVEGEFIDLFPLDGDWFFSGSTQGLEYPEAACIAAGLRPQRRPNADMRFPGLDGKDVPPLEALKRQVEYLFWAKEVDKADGMYLKHELTSIMTIFCIAEMARKEQLQNPNTIYHQGLHDGMREIQYLRKTIEPLMLERIASKRWRIDNLPDIHEVFPAFAAKAADAKKGIVERGPVSTPIMREDLADHHIKLRSFANDDLRFGDYEFHEIRDMILRDRYLDMTEAAATGRPMRPVDMKGRAATAHSGRSLFAPNLFDDTNERERQQAVIMLASYETIASSPGRSWYIAADDRLGVEGAFHQQAANAAYADELPHLLGQDFDETIRQPNRRHLLALPILARAHEKNQPVLFSTDIEDSFRAFEAEVSVAPGAVIPGPAAQQMARHALLARNITDFCFPAGWWEESETALQDMVLATRMQLGLEAAAEVDSAYVRVVDEHGSWLSLPERILPPWQKIKQALAQGRSGEGMEEQITALAQLVACHFLQSKHPMRKQIFKTLREDHPNLILPDDLAWEKINMPMFAYNHKEFEDICLREIMPALKGRLATSVRLLDLEAIDNFAEVARAHRREQRIQADGGLNQRSIYRRRPPILAA